MVQVTLLLLSTCRRSHPTYFFQEMSFAKFYISCFSENQNNFSTSCTFLRVYSCKLVDMNVLSVSVWSVYDALIQNQEFLRAPSNPEHRNLKSTLSSKVCLQAKSITYNNLRDKNCLNLTDTTLLILIYSIILFSFIIII